MRLLQQVLTTAVGYQSLGANTTGAYNVSMGSESLEANTTGNFNVGLGYAALEAKHHSI